MSFDDWTKSPDGPEAIDSSHYAQFDDSWHQWEVHFRPNDIGSTTGGYAEVWIDGVKSPNSIVNGVTVVRTRSGQGSITFNGMTARIAGYAVSGWLQLSNSTGCSSGDWQCIQNYMKQLVTNFINHTGEQPVCSPNLPSPDSLESSFDGRLGFDLINAICPGQANPVHSYFKYIDDVIMLYK